MAGCTAGVFAWTHLCAMIRKYDTDTGIENGYIKENAIRIHII